MPYEFREGELIGFNSITVQLRRDRRNYKNQLKLSFNSITVQLRLHCGNQ